MSHKNELQQITHLINGIKNECQKEGEAKLTIDAENEFLNKWTPTIIENLIGVSYSLTITKELDQSRLITLTLVN